MKIFGCISLEQGSAFWISSRPHTCVVLENFDIWTQTGILQNNTKYVTEE